jgi:hypothetical protein
MLKLKPQLDVAQLLTKPCIYKYGTDPVHATCVFLGTVVSETPR